MKFLYLSAFALLLCHSALAQHRWNRMELGPTFATSLSPPGQGPAKKFKKFAKAIAIRVGEGDNGAAFDTDRLRYAGGWTGGFVHINDGRDALLAHHRGKGALQWMTESKTLGWTVDGVFPAAPGMGPVDPAKARFTGHYLHGDRVVLEYTAGKARVLESPWLESREGISAFSRTVLVSGLDAKQRMLVVDVPGATETKSMQIEGVAMATAGQAKGDDDTVTAIAMRSADFARPVAAPPHRLCVEVDKPGLFRVFVWRGSASDLSDLAALVKAAGDAKSPADLSRPGPRRWMKVLETKGQLGKEKGPYAVDTITPPFDNPYKAILHFGGHDFFANGDAAICTMEGDVWLVRGIDDQLEKLTWQRFATGLHQPLGLKIVGEKIHVLGRDQITRLHDANNDGEADFYENFNNEAEVGLGTHSYSACLETDSKGNFYYIRCSEGGKHGGTIVKIPGSGRGIEVVATGFRNPNGFYVGGNDVITAADQQGTWVPSSRVDVIKPGGFYGFMPAHKRKVPPKTYDGPLCWIPHRIDNSCGSQVWVESDRWGPLNGEMLHLSYGRCTMLLVLREEVGGVEQGGVFQFPLKFASGVMRGRFRKNDGQLYLSGLRGWQTSAPKDGCLQRVRYTGKPLYMPVGLNVHANGLVIRFSEKLDKELAEDPGSWSVHHWNYRWTGAYGSKDYKVSDPKQTGRDPLEVTGAKLQDDGKSVFVSVKGLQPVMQMKIDYDLESADGKEMTSSIWNTIHALRAAR